MATQSTMLRGGLIITRRQEEEIEVDGRCTVIVEQCRRGRVKLRFVGPGKVRRSELKPRPTAPGLAVQEQRETLQEEPAVEAAA